MLRYFSNLSFLAARFFAVLLAASTAAHASTFDVTIDTSSLSGQAGGIYFQFSPGLDADPAAVTISDFFLSAPGKLIATSALNFSDGGASGSLGSNNLAINNSFALNDYGEALTFGSRLSFVVTLNIPPVLKGSSGSEFSVQVTGPNLLTPLLTSDPSGNAVEISYDQTGSLNVLSTTSAAKVTEAATTPEPGSACLVFAACCLLMGRLRWQARAVK